MAATDRALVEWQARGDAGRSNQTADPLDRDAVWAAKQAGARDWSSSSRGRAARQARFEAFCAREGEGLVDFATWCALAERHGLPMSTWPDLARDPRSEAVRQIREEMSDRVEFYMWLQWCLDEQLAAAQRTALEAGMPIGIVHDLAVGVHPEGADTWALADVLARGRDGRRPAGRVQPAGPGLEPAAVAARPARRAGLRAVPRHDPDGAAARRRDARRPRDRAVPAVVGAERAAPPTEGTYVRYDHEALIGILALEAHRAGAFVVGEDLGTVEPWVRDYLRDRGILGTSILWFERDWDSGRPLPPEQWRELCLATVTTHDLPPTAGYLAGEHIELRDRLGPAHPLGRGGARADDEASRRAWLDALRDARAARADGADASATRSRRCTGSWPRRRRSCSASRSPTRSATGAPSTSRGRTTSTRTGGCRCPTASGGRCCSRTS